MYLAAALPEDPLVQSLLLMLLKQHWRNLPKTFWDRMNALMASLMWPTIEMRFYVSTMWIQKRSFPLRH
jgi:hypothetical protein